MCGIVGIINKSRQPISKEQIKKITDTLIHRGPDDEGYYFGENFAFGHRRLSIIDLSPAGHQPMQYKGKNGEYVITFNGEIYNYLELREQLKKYGYIFNTKTDTEVILASYDRWGVECLSKFNGMWAFVIYDKNRNILFGARDRFGVKPFYYVLNENIFAFASEIKALLSLPYVKTSINEMSAVDYLIFGYEEQEEEGFFKGIYELFPSHAFIFDLKTFDFKKWRYYNLKWTGEYEVFDDKKLKRYSEELRELIFRAVDIRLRSDVPVGTCLSGGLDSSTIACTINEILKFKNVKVIGERQKVFTASYQDKNVDESGWAKIVVDKIGAEWHRTFPTEEELLKDLNDLIYTQEIPFCSTSIYAQYRVMKIARESGVKVVLDGQGGDEIFTGYTGYYPVFFAEILRNLDFKAIIRELKNINNSPVSLGYTVKSLSRKIGAKILRKTLLLNLISKRLMSGAKYINSDLHRLFIERLEYYIETSPRTLNEHLYQLITGKVLKSLLKYEDRNSMRFSIESRTPFADDVDLIEYMFKIPSVYKIHNGWNKYILRQAMRDILPKQIFYRKDKIGFETPEKTWLKNKKDFIIDIIKENQNFGNDYLNISLIIADIQNNKIYKEVSLLWRVLNFILWRERFDI